MRYPFLFTLASISAVVLTFQTASAEQQPAKDPSAEVEVIQVFGTREGNYTVITEDTQKLVDMPGALGDPLGAITALPGVISSSSGGDPAVRGSSPSDNRYLVDGMPAGYIFHAFSTSIFDENVVQDFRLYPAGFGAQYHNATGAVFDIRLRDPLAQPLQTTVSLSLLRAGIFIESEVGTNAALYVSARTGLLRFFYPEDDEPNEDGFRVESAPSDSDYIAKYVWSENPGTRVSVNLLGAKDDAAAEFTEQADLAQENPDFAGDARINTAFDSQSIRWEHTLAHDVATDMTFSHYLDRDELSWGDGYFNNTELAEWSLKGSVHWPLNSRRRLRVGAEVNHSDFSYTTRAVLFVCTEFDATCQTGRREPVAQTGELDTRTETVFLIDQWQATTNILLESGLQYTRNNLTNESFLNPRLALAWELGSGLRFKSSAGKYNRFPEREYLLPTFGNPDLSSPTAHHYTLGFEGDLADHWNWSLELYHKTLKNLPIAIGSDEPDAELLYTAEQTGEAQGIDLFLNRNLANKWYGWLALSYAQSERTNERTQTTQNYTLDTPVVVNMVANYQLTDKWNTGFRLTAKSGEANTDIIGLQPNPKFPDRYLPVYDQPYQNRLPYYARLDFRAERTTTWFGKPGSFFIDILNLTNRQNISGIDLDYKRVNETGELHLEKATEMGIIGSIGVSFTF